MALLTDVIILSGDTEADNITDSGKSSYNLHIVKMYTTQFYITVNCILLSNTFQYAMS